MNDEAYNPLDSLVFLTNRVGRLLGNRIKKGLEAGAELEEIFPHIGVMVDLWMKDGIRQQDLALSVIRDKGTVARSLAVLEKHGLVLRSPDKHDRRNKRIHLTDKGRRLRSQLTPLAEQTVKQATEGLDGEDVHVCKKVLRHLYEKLNEE